METRACCAAVAAIVLFIAAQSVRANSTNTVYRYGGPFDLAIPADPAETRGVMRDALIFVPDRIIISDLNVLVNIQHTAAIDLKMLLRSPSGRVVILADGEPRENFYHGANYTGTQFDDEADVAIEDALPPFTGPVRPCEELTAFDGRDAYGVWSLQICDMYYGDVGRLDSFVLMITGSPKTDGVSIPSPAATPLVMLGVTIIEFCRRPGLRRQGRLNEAMRRLCREPPAPVSS